MAAAGFWRISLMRKIVIALVAAAMPLPALAFDIPPRKAGQWKIEMQLPGPGKMNMVTELCLDANTDQQLMSAGIGMTSDCTTSGSSTVFDSVCTFGGMKTKSHVELTGDFQSSYSMKITSDIEGGPANMPKHTEMTQTATWQGACNGLQPGEMLMPGGMKMDALNVLKPGG
jgi:hypothetical protein